MRTIYREIVGAFIFSSDGKLLLGKTGVYSGKWAVPGGGIEPGETKLQALQREILEETGLDISNSETEHFKEIISGEGKKTLRDTGEKVLVKMNFHNFKVSLSQPADKINIVTEDDFTDARWFSVDDFPKLNISPPSITSLKIMGYL